MTNQEEQGSVAVGLRLAMERLRPTPDVRHRAWREFQRALDPLAPPRPLRRVRS